MKIKFGYVYTLEETFKKNEITYKIILENPASPSRKIIIEASDFEEGIYEAIRELSCKLKHSLRKSPTVLDTLFWAPKIMYCNEDGSEASFIETSNIFPPVIKDCHLVERYSQVGYDQHYVYPSQEIQLGYYYHLVGNEERSQLYMDGRARVTYEKDVKITILSGPEPI